MSEARLTYQCVDAEYVRTDSNSKPWYRAVIVTNDTDPDPATLDPAEVRGFPDNAGLAAGSIIMYPDDQHKIVYTDLSMTPAPGPEEEDTMTVNLTYDNTAQTLTMDTTAEEIITAMDSGKIVRTVVDMGDESMHMYYWGLVSATLPATEGTQADILVTMVDLMAGETVIPYDFVQAAEVGSYPVCTLSTGA